LEAFEASLEISLMSIAKLVQATKVYYLTVKVFVTSDLLLLNLRCVAGHITRECHIYVFGGRVTATNIKAHRDTLKNSYWRELIWKVEKLLYATDNLDNYCMHIQYIILYTSDG